MKDVELISSRLRRVDQIGRLPNSVLQQLALCGYYEDLEKGVTQIKKIQAIDKKERAPRWSQENLRSYSFMSQLPSWRRHIHTNHIMNELSRALDCRSFLQFIFPIQEIVAEIFLNKHHYKICIFKSLELKCLRRNLRKMMNPSSNETLKVSRRSNNYSHIR